MFRVPENTNVPKKIFQTIAIILSLWISLNKIIAANNQLALPKELFDNRIFCYAFQNPISIDTLQKNYYNFSLLSQEYNQKTKAFWDKNWFSIMEHVCAENRYTRMYFATIFYYQNEKIEEYFKEHVTIYQTLFYQSMKENFVSQPDITWLNNKDPNFTTFGPNGQMSFLEMLIKSHYYPISNKMELCNILVKQGALYDIWIYEGTQDIYSFDDQMKKETDIVKKLQGACLLSEYIAMHRRCTVELATEIMKKGTAAQEIFIKRFPKLELYHNGSIMTPPLPDDFAAKHHYSLFRLQGLMLDNIFIAKTNPYAYSNNEPSSQKSRNFRENPRNNGITYFQSCRGPSCKEILSLYNPDYHDSDQHTMDYYIEKNFYSINQTLNEKEKQERKKLIKDLYLSKMKFHLGRLYYIWLMGFYCIEAIKIFFTYLFKKFLKAHNRAYDVT